MRNQLGVFSVKKDLLAGFEPELAGADGERQQEADAERQYFPAVIDQSACETCFHAIPL